MSGLFLEVKNMFKRYIAVFILSVIPFTFVSSQCSYDKHNRGDACPFCKNWKHTNETPYVKGFKHEMSFIAVGAGLVTTGLILQSVNKTQHYTVDELGDLDSNSINAFDRPVTYNYSPKIASTSDMLGLGMLILPVVFLSTHHTCSDIASLDIMELEMGAITYGLELSVSNMTNRPRPYVYWVRYLWRK